MHTQHFTVFGGSFVHETHDGFAPACRPSRREPLAIWGLVLGSLLFGVATIATVTATAWAHGAAGF